ncbi:MAG: hypothetical protein M1833_004178 [Piccolia ochrophora]|nr:MAG: hypothetical protein M1833_004178 [Piccolia ochrophora]
MRRMPYLPFKPSPTPASASSLRPSHRHLHPSFRAYSTPSPTPLILERNIPAPHTGSIRVLSLNRPAARNAISRALLAELTKHAERLHDEGTTGPTRALVLASAVDGVFCAGADLKERASFTKEETTTFLTSLRRTFTLLATLPLPTISALSAPALGGGLELALTSDLRVFTSATTVGLPETRLGIIPGAGGTHRLPALIGLNRARDLVLTGRRVGAGEAYFLGLCDRVVEVEGQGEEAAARARERVLEEAVRLAREISEGGPVAIRAAKKAVEGWRDGSGGVEGEAYEEVVGTEDRGEALRAFAEKRMPVFKGR